MKSSSPDQSVASPGDAQDDRPRSTARSSGYASRRRAGSPYSSSGRRLQEAPVTPNSAYTRGLDPAEVRRRLHERAASPRSESEFGASRNRRDRPVSPSSNLSASGTSYRLRALSPSSNLSGTLGSQTLRHSALSQPGLIGEKEITRALTAPGSMSGRSTPSGGLSRQTSKSVNSRPRPSWRSPTAELSDDGRDAIVLRRRRPDDDFASNRSPSPPPPEEEEPQPVFIPPPEPEPIEEPEPIAPPPVEVVAAPSPAPVWIQPHEDPEWPNPSTQPVPYAEVRQKCGDRPLELAALAKIRAWERGPDAVYTVNEAMDVIRWLEDRLEPRGAESHLLWAAFCSAPRTKRAQVLVAMAFFLIVVLFLVGLTTFGALEVQKATSLESSVLTYGDKKPAASAAVIHPKVLLDYPHMSAGELRRAQDVVFQNGGDFHFHRISAATQTGPLAQIVGADGTTIQVQNNNVRVVPIFAGEEFIDQTGLNLLASARGGMSLAFAGAFRAHVPV